MDEDQHLLPVLANLFQDFGVADIVNDLELLDGLLVGDTNEFLLQRTWSESAVKVEEALVWVYTQEAGYVAVVGKSGTAGLAMWDILGYRSY